MQLSWSWIYHNYSQHHLSNSCLCIFDLRWNIQKDNPINSLRIFLGKHHSYNSLDHSFYMLQSVPRLKLNRGRQTLVYLIFNGDRLSQIVHGPPTRSKVCVIIFLFTSMFWGYIRILVKWWRKHLYYSHRLDLYFRFDVLQWVYWSIWQFL